MTEREIIPYTDIGPVRMPSIFLGDYGFLLKFGSNLSDEDVTNLMYLGRSQINIGLAAGEERCLVSARKVSDKIFDPTFIMYHSDIPLKLSGELLRYRTIGPTLLHLLRDTHKITIASDPIFNFLDKFDSHDRLVRDEYSKLEIDHSGVQKIFNLLDAYQPNLISIGGDVLDLLIMVGREDLAIQFFLALDNFVKSKNRIGVLATLYVGALRPQVSVPILGMVDGVMVPMNTRGVAMLPDRYTFLNWIKELQLPLIAMHTLAGGVIQPLEAIKYTQEAGAAACVIGASREKTINHLVHCAKIIFNNK